MNDPSARIGEPERRYVRDVLARALDQGYLDTTEHDHRLSRLESATSVDAAADLISDLSRLHDRDAPGYLPTITEAYYGRPKSPAHPTATWRGPRSAAASDGPPAAVPRRGGVLWAVVAVVGFTGAVIVCCSLFG